MTVAWISVHESIDGPKLRSLQKTLGCSTFEAEGILQTLWLWGLKNADKNGYILSADEEDIQRYLYGKGAGCEMDMKDVVAALLETRFLEKDEDGRLRFHEWDYWQKAWYQYQEKLEANRNAQRRKRAKDAMLKVPDEPEKTATDETQQREGLSIEPETQNEPPAKKEVRRPQYSDSFRELWKLYPKKRDDKAQAYAKYQARLNEGYREAELFEAVKGYAADVQKERTENKYILMAKTFFGPYGRFTQYLPKTGEPSQESSGNPFGEWGE